MVKRLRLGYALAGSFLLARAFAEIVGVPVLLAAGRFLFLGVFVGLVIAWVDARTHSRAAARGSSVAWLLLAGSLAVALAANRFGQGDFRGAAMDVPGVLLMGGAFVLFTWAHLDGPRRIVPVAAVGVMLASSLLVLAFWDALTTPGGSVALVLLVQGLHAMGNLLFGVAFLWASRRVGETGGEAFELVSASPREPLSTAPANRKP